MFSLLLDRSYRRGSTLGQGAPKTRPCPPIFWLQDSDKLCDTKHCSTNSKHPHIGAIRSILWPSKYAKMRFRPEIRPGARQGSSWHPSPYPISQRLDSPAFGARHSAPRFEGAFPRPIFSSRTAHGRFFVFFYFCFYLFYFIFCWRPALMGFGLYW